MPSERCGSRHVGNYDAGLMIDDRCVLDVSHNGRKDFAGHVGERFRWMAFIDQPQWLPLLSPMDIVTAGVLVDSEEKLEKWGCRKTDGGK